MHPVLTINVFFFGDKPSFSVSVGARYPAELNATISILQREGKPATYLVSLQGNGVPTISGEGRDGLEAALTLGYRAAKYLEQIDDRLATDPPAPYGENLEPDLVRSIDNGVEVVSRRAPE